MVVHGDKGEGCGFLGWGCKRIIQKASKYKASEFSSSRDSIPINREINKKDSNCSFKPQDVQAHAAHLKSQGHGHLYILFHGYSCSFRMLAVI